MLRVDDVGKTLGGRTLFDHVELRCSPSEVVVLTGENGSGKTTLLRIIAGLIEPSRGNVHICGFSLARDAVRAKSHLGYVPDGLEAVPELTVSEFITLVAALKTKSAGKRTHEDSVWKDRLGVAQTWSQRLRSLSFGQKKRIALFAALIGAPDLLVLDEPTNGLDPAGVTLIRQLLEERRQNGMMTVLSTNDADFERHLSSCHYHLAAGKLQLAGEAPPSRQDREPVRP
jgi:ABC-2 type transport system ATP-binding protein